jgi:enoyl-CoA hydratase
MRGRWHGQLFDSTAKVITTKDNTNRLRTTKILTRIFDLKDIRPGKGVDEMSPLLVEIQGPVGVITLNRPPVNALDLDTYRELTRVLLRLCQEDGLRALVLTGAGERAFCAGHDLKAIAFHDPLDSLERQQVVRDCLWTLYECPLPTVAALNGHAAGLGLMIASVCDMILAVEGSTLALPQVNLGLLGGAKCLSRIAPPHLVNKMVLTGERVPVELFHRWGSIDQVLTRGQLMPAAMALASSLAAKPAVAIRLSKRTITQGAKLDLKAGYDFELMMVRDLGKLRE